MNLEPNTVVVIEDEPFISKCFKEILENAGYSAICFLDFDSADDFIFNLELSDAKNICGVIFDYQLDENGRFNSVPLVRMMKDTPNFSGVMLANASDSVYNLRLLEAGCTHIRDKEYRKSGGAKCLIRILKDTK